MERQLKHLRIPLPLIQEIEASELVGKYLDFSTKVILLLERALAEESKKKPDQRIPLVEEKRAQHRHSKAR